MHFSFYFFVSFRATLSRSLKMAPVNTLRVVQLEFRASLESRDSRVQRDHLEIMDLKDPRVHVDTKVKQVLLELKAPLAPRDHKDPRVKLERRVIQVLEVPKVQRGFRDR